MRGFVKGISILCALTIVNAVPHHLDINDIYDKYPEWTEVRLYRKSNLKTEHFPEKELILAVMAMKTLSQH